MGKSGHAILRRSLWPFEIGERNEWWADSGVSLTKNCARRRFPKNKCHRVELRGRDRLEFSSRVVGRRHQHGERPHAKIIAWFEPILTYEMFDTGDL